MDFAMLESNRQRKFEPRGVKDISPFSLFSSSLFCQAFISASAILSNYFSTEPTTKRKYVLLLVYYSTTGICFVAFKDSILYKPDLELELESSSLHSI